MEANKYALQVTPHKCDQKPGGYISSCDHGGCGTKAYYIDSKGIGPGTDYKINTLNPFKYSILFTGTSMNVTLTQGTNGIFKFDVCSNNENYVEAMNEAMDYGMVLIMSYWGGSYSEMSWLDGMTGCTGDCQGVGAAIFSDIDIS